MHFILPYFIIILVVIQLLLKKSDNSQQNKIKQFWEREQKANATRKQDISNLNYVKWDDSLPLKEDNRTLSDILDNNNEALASYEAIMSLKGKQMINLTEYSNTDLKLKYGVANLETLTEYEDNYTSLIMNIATLGHILMEQEDTKDAAAYLELGIRSGSDIRSNYADLKNIYTNEGNNSGLSNLKRYAELIKSVNKDTIMHILDEA